MPSVEYYLEHADELVQDVVNAWAMNMKAGNTALLTAEFKDLFVKTCWYRTIKSVADNHRELKVLSEQEATEEQTARLAFVEAYMNLHENRANHASS